MKAHIGVDAATGLVHSLVSTAANVQDVTQAHALLHGEESTVFADAGYVGAQKREENQDTAGAMANRYAAGQTQSLTRYTRRKTVGSTGVPEGQGSHQGRAPVSRGEKPLLASQDPLSWLGEKYRADVQPVWASQSAAGQATFDAR